MPLDLTPLGFASARIKERHGDVFMGQGSFSDEVTPPVLTSLGAVRNITVEGTARLTSPDSHGRTHQRGLDLVVSWEVMQTDYSVEFATLPSLMEENNLLLKITDGPVTGADAAELSANAHAAPGIEFENITINLDFGLNFDGEDNVITLTSNIRITVAQLKQLGVTPIVLGG